MPVHAAQPLFAWGRLEDRPALSTIRDSLAATPDPVPRDGLVAARGHGRDDFPIDRLWRTVLLTTPLRRHSLSDCLAELHRDPSLCRWIDIAAEDQIPHGHNLSRFLDVLSRFLDVLGREPHRSALRGIFDALARRPGRAVPGPGRHTAGDATALNARPKANPAAVRAEVARGLPQPSGGKKGYTDDGGRVTKVVEWFGYKPHPPVDVPNEVTLAYDGTDTKAGDNGRVGAPVARAEANPPAGRAETPADDKAADDEAVHEIPHTHGTEPAIRNRALGKTEPRRVLPGGRRPLNLVHDGAGTVHCYDTVSGPPVRRRMSYVGYDKGRGTVKYRRPARHEGWGRPGDEHRNAARDRGLTARVPCELDLRRFPPIPRATKEFERPYKGRTAVGRVNARSKIFWGVGDGNGTGARRFHALVGTVPIVQSVFATPLARAPRREGTLGQTRLSPIAEALHNAAAA